MQGLDALKAAVPGFVRRKGRSGGRISALEAAYGEYQVRCVTTTACRAGHQSKGWSEHETGNIRVPSAGGSRALKDRLYSWVVNLYRKVRRRLDPLSRLEGMAYWNKRVERYGNRAVFDLTHPEDELEQVTSRQKEAVFPYLKAHLRGDERTVLDFGCGSGRLTADLASIIGGEAYGVDPVGALIEAAPACDGVHFQVMPEGELPFADSFFDVVFIFVVFCNITDDAVLARTVGELRRVLRPGGLLFFVDNTTDFPDANYVRSRNVEEYQQMFDFLTLEHLGDFYDLGDRYSIMAGRKT